MNIESKEQIKELIKAQDIVRQIYVQHNGSKMIVRLKELDKLITELINLIGSF